MKKDIFNGNIKQEYIRFTFLSILFAVVLFVAFAIFFVCVALLYDKVEADARVALFVVAGVCLFFAVFYPAATILSVHSYSKCKRLARLFLKPYVFVEEVSVYEQPNTDDKQ